MDDPKPPTIAEQAAAAAGPLKRLGAVTAQLDLATIPADAACCCLCSTTNRTPATGGAPRTASAPSRPGSCSASSRRRQRCRRAGAATASSPVRASDHTRVGRTVSALNRAKGGTMTHNSWLYRIPPWRMPRVRTHHYHHGHHTERIPIVRWTIIAYLFAIIWMLELEAWLAVWFYYGLFLGLRWCWRHNPIGQTIDSRQAARERQEPPVVATEHIDLGRLGNREES